MVSKFDAAKVIRFSLIKSSSRVYNGSSHFGTIVYGSLVIINRHICPLFIHGIGAMLLKRLLEIRMRNL